MARTATPAKEKGPNRIKQMWDVFQMTRKIDSRAIGYLVAGFALPVLVGVLLAILLSSTSVFGFVLYVIAGVLGGVLVFLIILGRRAERAAYSQIAGQPGAVGAVLRNSVRRGWQASEMPIAVSPRTQDAVYRAVGRGGIVLIAEGPRSRTQKMLDEERRRVTRILPEVPVNFLYVGPDGGAVPLHKISRELRRIKPVLRKSEIVAVGNRLASLTKSPVSIPKGIDPNRLRAQRPR